MVTLVVILCFLLLFFSWVLFVPLRLEVDTTHAVYQAYQLLTFRFWFTRDFCPNLRLFGISVPLATKDSPVMRSPKRQAARRSSSLRSVRALINGLKNSIHVKRFQLDVDTDDVVVNAKLVPVFWMLSRGPVRFSTNFEGRVLVNLLAEVRLYRIGWAFLLFKTKS
jgi:hypothetical protein